jgi:transcriptional regulator GlxA family with amidase domain
MKIQALLFDGFDELDHFGSFEALRMAGLAVETRSLHKQEVLIAAHGTKVIPDADFSLKEKPDLLLVPGGGWIARSPQGAWAEAQKGIILEVVRTVHESGIILASVCTGSLVLGKAGLLKGKMATTNHSAVQELIDCGARYVSARVVDSGNIITASGITASLDLGLWLLERFVSQAAAQKVSEALEFERRGIVHK